MNTTEILLESKTAREGQLTKITHESAIDTLSKAKALVFALWQGTGAATTEQMADYYQVPVETVRTVFKRHRDELDSDGVKVLRGKALSEAKFMMNLTEFNRPHLTIWTPRAALRLGMLLRDSQVAKDVRTVLLDVAEKVPDQEVQTESETIRELKLKIELAKLENRKCELNLRLVELHRQPESESTEEPLATAAATVLKAKETERQQIEAILLDLLKFIVERGGTITTRELCLSRFRRLKFEGKKFNAFFAHRLLRAIADAGYGSFVRKTFTADTEKCDRENLAKLSRWKSC